MAGSNTHWLYRLTHPHMSSECIVVWVYRCMGVWHMLQWIRARIRWFVLRCGKLGRAAGMMMLGAYLRRWSNAMLILKYTHTNRYDDAWSIFKMLEQCDVNTKIHSREREGLYARSDLHAVGVYVTGSTRSEHGT
ncbi:hypothetical protein Tco_0928285 [Tanacetum coccineum]